MRRPAGVAGLDGRNGIAHRGDGTVFAEAAIGVGTVIDRLAPLASVRGSLEQGTEQDGVGPGEKAGDKVDMLGVVLVLLDQIAHKGSPQLRYAHGPTRLQAYCHRRNAHF